MAASFFFSFEYWSAGIVRRERSTEGVGVVDASEDRFYLVVCKVVRRGGRRYEEGSVRERKRERNARDLDRVSSPLPSSAAKDAERSPKTPQPEIHHEFDPITSVSPLFRFRHLRTPRHQVLATSSQLVGKLCSQEVRLER